MMKPLVQIYIMTCNRPEMAMDALHSVMSQKYSNFHVTLSDNSTNDQTKNAMKGIDSPRFSYIRRIPPISPYLHFQKVFSEITAEYFILFHDDDIMLKGAIEKYMTAMELFPDASAIGANAYILLGGQKTKKTFIFRKQGFFRPEKSDFITRYLRSDEIVPFPSYMYRKSKVKDIFFDPQKGGKYSDVCYLIDLFQVGELVWILKPLMFYRVHESQDSAFSVYSHSRRLIKYIESLNVLPKKSKEISYFKALQFYSFWRGSLARGTAQRHHLAFMKIFIKLIYLRPTYFLPRVLYHFMKSGFIALFGKRTA